MSENTQVEELLERVSHVPANTEGEAKRLPLVPFQGDLVLTREQEDRLMQHCDTMLTKHASQMGRDATQSNNWWEDAENVESSAQTWMGKRERFEASFNNKVEWRKEVLGGIFQHSNLTAPISRRITRQMVARANNYFFGTDPWFAARAERGTADDALAEKIDHYAKYKLRESGSKSAKEKAVELAFVRGECVLKSVYKRRVDYYETTAEVLVDVNAEPILTNAGDFIFKNDRWVRQILIDGETGVEEETEIIVLERDPAIKRPEALLWKSERIRRQLVQFEGAECKPVYFKDFLCSLDAENVQESEFVAHLYDMPLMELAETYRQREVITDSEEDARKEQSEWEATVRAVDLIRELSNADGRPKAAKKQLNSEQEELEQAEPEVSEDSVNEIAECMLYYDANNDGIREHIMVIMDRESKRPIYYDYLANITPDGERPYDVVRPIEIDGRWYGMGAMELFDSSQQIIDLLVNRWNYANSKAGRITFWNPQLTLEGERNSELKLKDGGTYTPKPGVDIEQILKYVSLPNVEHDYIKDMFEFFMQMAMNESGVQHANDANMTGLDQAKLATGIRNIEKSGMEMFGAYISCILPSLQNSLSREINLIFANLDKAEAFEYFDRGTDDPATARLLEISPEEVQNLTVRVNVLMTRYQGEQTMQQASTGWNTVKEFYGQPPEVQARTAQFVIMMIKALDLGVDAEATIQPLPLVAPPQSPGVDGEQAAAAVSPLVDNTPTPNL